MMIDILEQLTIVAAEKDENTKMKILAIREQLALVLTRPNPNNPALTPSEFLATQKLLPEVMQLTSLVNEILLVKLQGKSGSIRQKDIVEAWKKKYGGKNFEFARLDAMERCFRDAGWKVEYNSTSRDDGYDAYFSFTIK